MLGSRLCEVRLQNAAGTAGLWQAHRLQRLLPPGAPRPSRFEVRPEGLTIGQGTKLASAAPIQAASLMSAPRFWDCLAYFEPTMGTGPHSSSRKRYKPDVV